MEKQAIEKVKNQLKANAKHFAETIVEEAEGLREDYSFTIYYNNDGDIGGTSEYRYGLTSIRSIEKYEDYNILGEIKKGGYHNDYDNCLLGLNDYIQNGAGEGSADIYDLINDLKKDETIEEAIDKLKDGKLKKSLQTEFKYLKEQHQKYIKDYIEAYEHAILNIADGFTKELADNQNKRREFIEENLEWVGM